MLKVLKWIGIAAAVLFVIGLFSDPKPKSATTINSAPSTEVKPVANIVPFPNVIGTPGKIAQKTIEDAYPNGSALVEAGGDTYRYGVDNRCLWVDQAGKQSSSSDWPVVNVVLILNPNVTHGTSPTEPVPTGRPFGKFDRVFFSLTTEKPQDIWCRPYGDVGPAGSLPNVNLPNNDDGGESWPCRRTRWC